MIKKICIFTYSFSPNKKAMLDYLEKIFPEQIKIFLFTAKNHKDRYKKSNFKRIKIADTHCSKIFSFLELRKFCKKNKIERIMNIGQLPYEGVVLAYASFLTKTDFICYHLGNPIDSLMINHFKTRIRARLEAIVSYFFAIFPKKIILVSENQTKRIKKYLFFARKKIFCLYPTIPTSLFKPKNKKLSRKKLKMNIEDKVIIFVGRIGYLKGVDILIELIKRNSDKKFILIGQIIDGGIEKHNFKNLVLIPSKTHKELIDYYNAADLCFFPSRIEGSPLVPREAMSCGTPTLTSKIPSTESIKPAIRVELNADKMDQELNNFFHLPKKEKKRLSSESRKFIIDKFDDCKWEKEYIDKLLN